MSTAASQAKSGANVTINIEPQTDGTIRYRTPDGKDAATVKAYRGWKVQWQTAKESAFAIHFPDDCPGMKPTYRSAEDAGAAGMQSSEMDISKTATALQHYEYYVAVDYGDRIIIDDPDVHIDEC